MCLLALRACQNTAQLVKNTQRYYAPKCLIRHIRYMSPHPMVAHSKTDQMKQVRLTCRRVVSGTCHDLSWGGGGGRRIFLGGHIAFRGER